MVSSTVRYRSYRWFGHDWGTLGAASISISYGSWKVGRGVGILAVSAVGLATPAAPAVGGLGRAVYDVLSGGARVARGFSQADSYMSSSGTGIIPQFSGRLPDFIGGLP
jgi:hypothetical protein